MTIDQINERLRLGLATPEDAEAFCAAWNASNLHFSTAHYYGGRVLLFPIP